MKKSINTHAVEKFKNSAKSEKCKERNFDFIYQQSACFTLSNWWFPFCWIDGEKIFCIFATTLKAKRNTKASTGEWNFSSFIGRHPREFREGHWGEKSSAERQRLASYPVINQNRQTFILSYIQNKILNYKQIRQLYDNTNDPEKSQSNTSATTIKQ